VDRPALISSRLEEARRLLEPCTLCPRRCAADRLSGETGECGCGPGLEVSAVSLHTGEEPALGGPDGACNVFLTGCNLHCLFCQNHPISHLGVGRPESVEGLVDRVRSVVQRGARVLSLVTGTHQVPAILEALVAILDEMPDLVVAWNGGGYERVETLRLLDGIVDVYLPDFKFWQPGAARELADAPDYPEVAREALLEMARQVGPLEVGEDGLARRGLIVRHLVLPGDLSGTRSVLSWIASSLPRGTAVSLMGQYVPSGRAVDHPLLGRRLRPEEYDRACRLLRDLGLETGWVQEG
jgi:putative pyruvate formate lyase activating enzyme